MTEKRMFPASDIAERGTICSFLLAPQEVGALCSERGVKTGHFHNPALGMLHAMLMDMWARNERIDVITLTTRLADRNLLEQAGGAAAVSELFTYMPTATNIVHYLEILEKKLTSRRIIGICDEYRSRAFEEQDNEGLLSEFMGAVNGIGSSRKSSYVPMLERVTDKMNRMENTTPDANLIVTGITKLDRDSPFHRGDMAVVAGKQKAGKSVFACSISRNILDRGGAVFYSTLEQTAAQEIDRLIHGFVRVPISRNHASKLSQIELDRFSRITETAEWRLDLRDDLFEINAIIGGIRQAKARWPDLHLAVIDYAQLVQGIRHKGDSRQMEVASVSRMLRQTFKEVGCAGMLLSQLNDDGQTREARDLEMDMTAMWHIEIPQPEKTKGKPEPAEVVSSNKRHLNIPRQRNGESGIRFTVSFQGALGVVGNYAHEENGEVELDQWTT